MRTLILDGTTISIQVAMSTSAATINPTFVASFADHAGSGITEGASDGVLNGSTDVTVVGPPTGANRRIIKDITIFNGDTAPVTVLIKYDNNATQRTLVKVTLAIGDTYTTDGTFDANGNLKQSTTIGGDVVGPASSTDNAITRFDATTGKLIQNSLVTIADNGAITAPDVGSVIPFYYPNQAAFPSASTYHGALAHSHADGAMFFAHGGVWIRLLDAVTTVTVAQGGTGATTLSGAGIATFTGTETLTNKTLGATTLSGALSCADQVVNRAVLEDYAIQGSAIGNVGATRTFDLSVANFFSATLNQACTFTFSNPPAAGDFGVFVLELTNGGAFAITYPASVDFIGGVAPTLTAAGVDQLAFTTRDGGTTFFAFVAGLDIKSP